MCRAVGDAPRTDGVRQIVLGVDRPGVDRPACLLAHEARGVGDDDASGIDGVRMVAKARQRRRVGHGGGARQVPAMAVSSPAANRSGASSMSQWPTSGMTVVRTAGTRTCRLYGQAFGGARIAQASLSGCAR